MKTKENFKVFEHGTVAEVLKRMLKEGYVPLNFKQVWDLKKSGKITQNLWYDTRTICIDGQFRNATIGELKNIKSVFQKGGRLAYLNNYDYGLGGNNGIGDSGRFVGVRGKK